MVLNAWNQVLHRVPGRVNHAAPTLIERGHSDFLRLRISPRQNNEKKRFKPPDLTWNRSPSGFAASWPDLPGKRGRPSATLQHVREARSNKDRLCGISGACSGRGVHGRGRAIRGTVARDQAAQERK